LRFCGFAFNSGQGLRVDQQATIACDVGSNGRVDFVNQAVIIGDVVSIEDTVHLDQEVRVEGNVAAGGDVQLKKDAVVSGDVTAAGPVFVEVGAVVSGTISQNTGVPPSSVITSPSLSLIAGTQDIIVEKSNSPFTLAPGSYGKLEVRTEATLNLSAGVYAFEEIRLDRQAIVNLDVSAGTILIDVVKGVSTSEEVQMLSNGSAENILFRVQGDQVTLHLNGVYLGTFLAPNGTINLEQGATLTGALYGQNVNVKHRARLIGAPAVALLFNGLSDRP
jgi:cytoskeletal protein CcmA (bactofilin family)